MNERIRELTEQAGEYVNSVYTLPVRSKTSGKIWEDGHIGWNEQFQEKFASLIIEECIGCIDIMEKIGNSTNASIPKDYDKHTYLETLDTLRGLLKTHFGVEE